MHCVRRVNFLILSLCVRARQARTRCAAKTTATAHEPRRRAGTRGHADDRRGQFMYREKGAPWARSQARFVNCIDRIRWVSLSSPCLFSYLHPIPFSLYTCSSLCTVTFMPKKHLPISHEKCLKVHDMWVKTSRDALDRA